MVSHDEMFDRLIKRREEYLESKRRRRAVIVKSAVAVSGLCAAAALGIGIYTNSHFRTPEGNNISVQIPEITEPAETTAFTENTGYTDTAAQMPQNDVTSAEHTSEEGGVTAAVPVTSVYSPSSSGQTAVSDYAVTESKNNEESAVTEKPVTAETIITTEKIITEESKPETVRPSVPEWNPPESLPFPGDKEEIDMNKKTIAFLSALLLAATPEMIISHAAETADQPMEGTTHAILTYVDSNIGKFDFDSSGEYNGNDLYALYAYIKAPEILPEGYAEKIEASADITGDGKIDLADYDLMSIYEQCKDEDLSTEQFSYGTEDFINEFSRANFSANLGSMDITSFIYELLVDSSDGLVSKAEKGEIDTDINGDGITDLRDLYDLYIYSIKEKGTPDIICSYAHPELSEDDVSRISEKAASFAEYTESADGLKKLITLYIKKSDIRALDLTPEAYRDIYKISYDDDVLIYEYDVNAQDAAAKYEAEHPDGPDKKYLWHSLESDFVLRVAGVMEDIEETSDARKIYDNGIIVSTGDCYFYEFDDHAVLWRYYGTDEKIIIPNEINGKPVTDINMYALAVDLKFNNPAKYAELPDSLKVIKENTFLFNQQLENVKLPENLVEIEDGVFNGRHLKSIDLPDGLEKIGALAFFGNRADTVTIPKSVTYIGENAFVQEVTGGTKAVYPENIYVYAGSYGEKYALEHDVPCIIIGSEADLQKYASSENTDVTKGDVDGNGKVDITDLSELSLSLIGDKTLTENQINAADADGNGKADLSDLARLRQYLSKVITSL